MIAPYGTQNKWTISNDDADSDGFRTYMACGNTGDEGETGDTWTSLLIVEPADGFKGVTPSKTQANEYTIEDFTFTFKLNDKYPVGTKCPIEVKYDSTKFKPSEVYLNTKACTVGTSSADCYVP